MTQSNFKQWLQVYSLNLIFYIVTYKRFNKANFQNRNLNGCKKKTKSQEVGVSAEKETVSFIKSHKWKKEKEKKVV